MWQPLTYNWVYSFIRPIWVHNMLIFPRKSGIYWNSFQISLQVCDSVLLNPKECVLFNWSYSRLFVLNVRDILALSHLCKCIAWGVAWVVSRELVFIGLSGSVTSFQGCCGYESRTSSPARVWLTHNFCYLCGTLSQFARILLCAKKSISLFQNFRIFSPPPVYKL